jgi:hypothetical protein
LLLKMECECRRQRQSIAQLLTIEHSVNPSGAMTIGAAPVFLALIPVTYVLSPFRTLTSQRQTPPTNPPNHSSLLTKPDSIVQSLTHALIKLIPGVGVRQLLPIKLTTDN